MERHTQARFVVLEGLDGTGTTTQVRLLAEALQARDLRVHATAEPSDGPIGRVVRAHVTGAVTLDAPTAALAFTADRADHLAREIRPALAAGSWVVCDRYLLSTLAYQGAEGVDEAWILAMNRDADVPDLVVFLDLPDDERERRMSRRTRIDRYERRELAEDVRAGYLRSIDVLRDAGHDIVVVDGAQPPDGVLSAVLAELDARWGRS